MNKFNIKSRSLNYLKKENLIEIPNHSPIKRIPGKYTDNLISSKKRNNYMILQSCKLLKSFYNEEGIIALILDGKEMRTFNALQKLEDKLKKISIVECDNPTFNYMEKLVNKNINKNKIKLYNMHLKNYIDFNKCDPYTNVVYFDAMSSLFSSYYSFGTDIIINEFLKKNKCNEIIFGLTACLRDGNTLSFKLKEKKILILLDKIFLGNGFNYINLNKDSRYKGQRMSSKCMVFLLFFLKRI